MKVDNGISLEGKMNDWGPYGELEGKWFLFSMGNPEEGHSYALPRNIDDLASQHITHLISCKTGGRYVAHIPWSTDTVASIAKDWSPKSLEPEELKNRLIPFLKYHIQNYQEMGLGASKIFIYSFHGGNNPIAKYSQKIKKELHLDDLIIARTDQLADNIAEEVLRKLHGLSSQIANENENPNKVLRKLIKIVTSIDHAGHCEHSIGAAIGILDQEKLAIMNNLLESDFEKAVNKWPTLAGLGGFLLHGGKYSKELGTKENDIHGHWKCFNTLRKLDNGRIVALKQIGTILIEAIVDYYSRMIIESTRKL
jgi:hypothetical protein